MIILWSCHAFVAPVSSSHRHSAMPSTRLFVETPSQQQQAPDSITIATKSSSPRRVASVERFARLPVWPVWNGVAIFVVSRLFGKDVAAKLEDAIGGRVCPNFFNPPDKTSPFIMLVHHRHSFAAWDPLRYIQRTFFPEGFPAHPVSCYLGLFGRKFVFYLCLTLFDINFLLL